MPGISVSCSGPQVAGHSDATHCPKVNTCGSSPPSECACAGDCGAWGQGCTGRWGEVAPPPPLLQGAQAYAQPLSP